MDLEGQSAAAFAGLILASLLVAAPPAAADTTAGNLPGGTSIAVGIDTPADDALIASPGDVSLSGSASIGQGVPVANTTLIYVVDRSGSTQNPALTTTAARRQG